MSDRFIALGWRLAILGMIFVSGFACLFLGYHCLLHLLEQQWLAGVGPFIASTVLGTGSYLLCQHRNDLLWL